MAMTGKTRTPEQFYEDFLKDAEVGDRFIEKYHDDPYYTGKYMAIVDRQIIGIADTEDEVVEIARAKIGDMCILIQKVSVDEQESKSCEVERISYVANFPIKYSLDHCPYPHVEAELRNAQRDDLVLTARAKIDTGSDITVIPKDVPLKLNCQLYDGWSAGFDGNPRRTMRCALRVYIDGVCYHLSRCAVGDTTLLLGRDVLNEWQMMLDGPRGQGHYTVGGVE